MSSSPVFNLKACASIFGTFFSQLEAGILLYCKRDVNSSQLRELCVKLCEKEDQEFLEKVKVTLEKLGETFTAEHGSLKELSPQEFYLKKGALFKEQECVLKKEYVGGLTNPPYIWSALSKEVVGAYPLWVEKLVVPYYRDLTLVADKENPHQGITEEEMKKKLLRFDNADIIKQNVTKCGGGKGRSCPGAFATKALEIFTDEAKKEPGEMSAELYEERFGLLDKVINVFFATHLAIGASETYYENMKVEQRLHTSRVEHPVGIYKKLESVQTDLKNQLLYIKGGAVPPLDLKKLVDIEVSGPENPSSHSNIPKLFLAESKTSPKSQEVTPRTEEAYTKSIQYVISDLYKQLGEINPLLERLRKRKIKEISSYMYNFIPGQVSDLQKGELPLSMLEKVEANFECFEAGRQSEMEKGGEKDNLGGVFTTLLRCYELEKVVKISLKILEELPWVPNTALQALKSPLSLDRLKARETLFTKNS